MTDPYESLRIAHQHEVEAERTLRHVAERRLLEAEARLVLSGRTFSAQAQEIQRLQAEIARLKVRQP